MISPCFFKETMLLLFFFLASLFLISTQETLMKNDSLSLSFPLTSLPHSPQTSPKFYSSFISQTRKTPAHKSAASSSSPYNYRSRFKYSMILLVSLPIGTPPQSQQMILDTGSQLSWIQCHKNVPRKPPPRTVFDPSLSSSFSVLPCNHPLCKPRIPDFTLPTSCDLNRLCHYSYFYADGTLAEGNLVREKITFSTSQSTPPLILGCAEDTSDDKGILGMNLGRLSFASQAKITKFSYCVPTRQGGAEIKKGYVYGGVSDMCFDGKAMEIGRLIGNMVFEFEKGVEIVIEKERVLAAVGGGVHCVGIGRSEMLGAASNIIGNFHQQNLWVEFDIANRRVGFGKADCSRSV